MAAGFWTAKVQRGCVGKVRHASRGKAEAHARALVRRGDTGVVNVYPCPRCATWHVGHSKGKP